MADESDDILRHYYPGSPNWLSPEDMRRGILDRYGPQNQFALPPKPRPVVENDHTRPDAYVDKRVREDMPFHAVPVGAMSLGRTIGTGYEDWKLGDYRHAAMALPEIAMAMAPMPGPKRMPHRVDNPIRAYHGSPHDFDRFDLSKIGTGEGAQAYGHGLYFSEKPDVAQYYREALSARPSIDGKPILNQKYKVENSTGHPFLDEQIERAFGDVALARQTMQANLKAGPSPSDLPFWQELARKRVANSEAALARLDELEKAGAIGRVSPGKTYEVAIHASPDQFLDWDKPLSQQSEAVKKRVLSALPEQNRSYFEKWALDPDVTARDVYESIGSALAPGDGKAHASPKVASSLREQGIPGIRYLDQGSRNTVEPPKLVTNPDGSQQWATQSATGVLRRFSSKEAADKFWQSAEDKGRTSNYVVFNPELIEIMRKYGLLGPVAGLTTADILAQYNKTPPEQQ